MVFNSAIHRAANQQANVLVVELSGQVLKHKSTVPLSA